MTSIPFFLNLLLYFFAGCSADVIYYVIRKWPWWHLESVAPAARRQPPAAGPLLLLLLLLLPPSPTALSRTG
jgi:hypothetical protein